MALARRPRAIGTTACNGGQNMVSHLLPQSVETLRIVEHMLLLPHAFERLDASFVGYWNVYCLFNLILAGRVIVAGSFDEKDGRLLGICWGEFSGSEFIAHAAYERGASATEGIKGCITALRERYPGMSAIICFLPDFNRVIRRTVKRIGFRCEGPAAGCFLTDRAGIKHPCTRYALNLEV